MSKYVIALVVFFLPCLNVFAQIDDNNENMHHALLAKSDSLFALGVDLYNAGKYEEAIPVFTESDKIDKAVLDSTSNRRDYSAMWLASCYYQLGDTIKASETNQDYKITPIDRRLTIKSDSLSYAGIMAFYNRDFENALSYFTRCAEIEKFVVGEDHIFYMNTILGIAVTYHELAYNNYYLGNYQEAIRLGTEACNILEKVYGKEHADYATSLNNLSNYNISLGNYQEAVRLCTEALNIRRSVWGTAHPDYATSLNNLASCNYNLGNYSEAISLSTEALNIFESIYGREHLDCAISLNNIASCNASLGNYSEAIRDETEALNIFKKRYGREYPAYATFLNNLAIYNFHLDKYSEAIDLVTEALNISERKYGKEHPDYAKSLNSLAYFNFSTGNYSEAIRLGVKTMNIYERVFCKRHPEYATSLSNLAGYCFKSRDSQLSNYYTLQSSELFSTLIKNTFNDITTAQRTKFWGMYSNWYEQIIHRHSYCMPSDSLTFNGYNGVLLSKGLLLNSEIEFSKLIQESGDNEAVEMYEDLRMLRLQINRLLETPISERFASVDSLERIAQAKEQALIERSKVYGDYMDNLVITWEQVQEKLTDKDIAVEFVSFPLNADSTMYVAYVVRKGWEYPRMIPLFEEKQLKKIYSGEYYTTTEVSQLIWQPLEEVLQGVETIYFAPSGELYNIAIESVPDYVTNAETIVSDSRTYYRLSSTRELALKKDKDVWKEAAVYGGLKYGMTAESLTADSRSFGSAVRSDIALTNELYNIADTLSVMRGGELAKSLPGTRIEAEAIDKSLEASGVLSTLYTDSIGTEASFKNLNGKKTSIMHIGTHGFYWTEKEAKTYDYKFLMNDETSSRYVEDKQLTRSGLLFAGANYVLSGSENQLPEGVDDGILTAKELTTIDLRGLDLVVLSACQTGLGEITGDGVFGLQRGFKKAGAQTIVMSLWKVNDEATRLFMTKFFDEIRLDKDGHPTNKHEAFLAAQHYLRDEYEIEQTRVINGNLTASQIRRLEREGKSVEAKTITEKVKPYADPEYWAAFIMLDGVD